MSHKLQVYIFQAENQNQTMPNILREKKEKMPLLWIGHTIIVEQLYSIPLEIHLISLLFQ